MRWEWVRGKISALQVRKFEQEEILEEEWKKETSQVHREEDFHSLPK